MPDNKSRIPVSGVDEPTDEELDRMEEKALYEEVPVATTGTTHETSESRGHDSRVDELSEERATHQDQPLGPWVRPSSLDAPEPRPGMVQRWVRISMRGVDDPRNVNLRMREGWKPRPVETVPEEFRVLAERVEHQTGRLIVDDLMLCEMPEGIYAQRKAYYEQLTRDQMAAVEHDLEDTEVPGHRITKTHTSTVSHPPKVIGRRVEAAADD